MLFRSVSQSRYRGGSISNGPIVGYNTVIKADIVKIFSSIIFEGTWCIEDVKAAWFGVSQTAEDNTNFINNAFKCCWSTRSRILTFHTGIFKIKGIVVIGNKERNGWDIIIKGSGANQYFGTTFVMEAGSYFYGGMENYNYGQQRSGAIIDCCFTGGDTKGKGIVLDFCQTYDICRCNFQRLESGITLTGSAYFVKINSCRFLDCTYAVRTLKNGDELYKEGGANNNQIDSCFFYYNEHPIDIQEGGMWHVIS